MNPRQLSDEVLVEEYTRAVANERLGDWMRLKAELLRRFPLSALVVGPDGSWGPLMQEVIRLRMDFDMLPTFAVRERFDKIIKDTHTATLAHARQVAGGQKKSLAEIDTGGKIRPEYAGDIPPADPVDAVIEALTSIERTPSDLTPKVKAYEAGVNAGIEIAILYLSQHRDDLRGVLSFRGRKVNEPYTLLDKYGKPLFDIPLDSYNACLRFATSLGLRAVFEEGE